MSHSNRIGRRIAQLSCESLEARSLLSGLQAHGGIHPVQSLVAPTQGSMSHHHSKASATGAAKAGATKLALGHVHAVGPQTSTTTHAHAHGKHAAVGAHVSALEVTAPPIYLTAQASGSVWTAMDDSLPYDGISYTQAFVIAPTSGQSFPALAPQSVQASSTAGGGALNFSAAVTSSSPTAVKVNVTLPSGSSGLGSGLNITITLTYGSG